MLKDKRILLLNRLYALSRNEEKGLPSDWHLEADNLLLDYINDEQITEAFERIEKWYS